MIHASSGTFDVAPEIKTPLLPPDRPSLAVLALTWLTVGSLALSLHAGLYVALTHRSELPPPPPIEEAAIMINLAPIVVTAPSEVDNAADGPASTEQEAIEEQVEEVAELPPERKPEAVTPQETVEPVKDVKADAVLPPKPLDPPQEVETVEEKTERKLEKQSEKKKPVKKPEKTKKKVKDVQKAQAAQKKGGGPQSKENTGKRSAAVTTGGSSASNASQADWLSKVRGKIVRAKRYPSAARARREEGSARVSVTFDASGTVTSAQLISSSGSEALDGEAVAVMRRAGRFPPPPAGKTTLVIPINFSRK